MGTSDSANGGMLAGSWCLLQASSCDAACPWCPDPLASASAAEAAPVGGEAVSLAAGDGVALEGVDGPTARRLAGSGARLARLAQDLMGHTYTRECG